MAKDQIDGAVSDIYCLLIGRSAKILVGETAAVGEVIGYLEESDGDAEAAAAAQADPAFYRDRGLEGIPARGPLAANTVAGAVSGWRP